METGDTTVECQEMDAVKEGNHTLAADDIDQCVSRNDCLCLLQFVNHYPEILKCDHVVGVSQIGFPAEPHSMCSVEIHSLTCSL